MQPTTRDIMTTISAVGNNMPPMTKAQRKALRRASARQQAAAQCVIPHDRDRHIKVILIVRRTQWSDWAKLSILSDINAKLSTGKLTQHEANALALGAADAWQRQGMFAEVRVQWRYAKPPIAPAKDGGPQTPATATQLRQRQRQRSETRKAIADILSDLL